MVEVKAPLVRGDESINLSPLPRASASREQPAHKLDFWIGYDWHVPIILEVFYFVKAVFVRHTYLRCSRNVVEAVTVASPPCLPSLTYGPSNRAFPQRHRLSQIVNFFSSTFVRIPLLIPLRSLKFSVFSVLIANVILTARTLVRRARVLTRQACTSNVAQRFLLNPQNVRAGLERRPPRTRRG